MSEPILSANAPWNQDWPPGDLDRVPVCPICGGTERSNLHEDLVDNAFFVAPGKWSLHGCAHCGGAYLDPRPSKDSIHRAYASYYTHQVTAAKDAYTSLSPVRKLRRRLVNGYTNWRYSTREHPSSRLGLFMFAPLWGQRNRLASEYRHLPRHPEGGGTLLDVGCGSGAFLRVAQSAGWNVTGVDPDPSAVKNCHNQGLDVLQGGLERFSEHEALFDVITLNHVIEHVPDPVLTLQACHRLLKPKGQLWLATPNINSLGHQRYGPNWRGIEAPRHLVLFNQKSLATALKAAGFKKLVNKASSNPLRSMTLASEAIRSGHSPDQVPKLSLAKEWAVVVGRLRQIIDPSVQEFLTVIAYRDESNLKGTQ
ncbi:class I SAM-dependent methyltransferase [Hydrogenophaga sp.]|uniref:class I SAM-dependent methyltransferase n=1 Tax=Hydrogenophaga sp. TaxID=1904254 RepID=UPI00286E87BB|nr:class I SAM-dependent methyltransferase [Hydrogenophaga sp.]